MAQKWYGQVFIIYPIFSFWGHCPLKKPRISSFADIKIWKTPLILEIQNACVYIHIVNDKWHHWNYNNSGHSPYLKRFDLSTVVDICACVTVKFVFFYCMQRPKVACPICKKKVSDRSQHLRLRHKLSGQALAAQLESMRVRWVTSHVHLIHDRHSACFVPYM